MVCHKGYLGITGPDRPDRTLYRGQSQRLSRYYWSMQTWQNSIPWSVTKAISVLLVNTNLTELYTVVCHKGYLSISVPYKPDRTIYHGQSKKPTSILLVHTNLIKLYTVACHKGYLNITGQNKHDRTLYRGLSQRLSQYFLVETNLTELYTVVCHKGYLGITGPYKPDRALYRGLSQRLSRYYWSIQAWQNSIPWSVTKAISVLLVH